MKPSRLAQRTFPHIADVSLGEDVDLVIGLTAAALIGNEVAKLAKSHQHQGSHLVKAGLSAVVAAGALKMMQREHQDHHAHYNGRSREYTWHHCSPGILEEDQRHEHRDHGSYTHHNQAWSSREYEHRSDYIGHILEGHQHHHRRHSLDSTRTSGLLPVDQKCHCCDDRSDDSHMSVPAQTQDMGRHHVHFLDGYDQGTSRNSRRWTQRLSHLIQLPSDGFTKA